MGHGQKGGLWNEIWPNKGGIRERDIITIKVDYGTKYNQIKGVLGNESMSKRGDLRTHIHKLAAHENTPLPGSAGSVRAPYWPNVNPVQTP